MSISHIFKQSSSTFIKGKHACACKCTIIFQQYFLFISCKYNFIIITFRIFIYWRVFTITRIWSLYMLLFLLFILDYCFLFYVLTAPLSLMVYHKWQPFSSINIHVNKGEQTTQPIKKHCGLLKTVMNRLPTSQGEQLIYMQGGEYSRIQFVFY